MKDDKIEVVDLSPEDGDGSSLKDFIDEQIEYLNSLIAAAHQSESDEAPVEVLAAYVRGANAASEEAIVGAWPELRNDGTLSSENSRKVNMTGTLCGMIISKTQELMGNDDPNMRAIGLLIMIQMQRSASKSSASIAQAVTIRATADELLVRAREEEAEK